MKLTGTIPFALFFAFLFALLLAPAQPTHGARPAPSIISAKLDNGVRILILPDRAAPTVTASLWIGSGWVHNPRGREGIADLCAAVHERRVVEAILGRRIGKPYLARSFDSVVSSDHTAFSVAALAPDLDPALEVLGAVAGAGEEAFSATSSLKREALANLMRTRFAPGLVAREALGAVLFGDRRPLGFSARFQTLLGVLPADVRAFHADHYRPANAILTLEGAVEAQAARIAAARRFGDWKVTGAPEPPAWGRAAQSPARAGVTLIDDPDATEAVIIAGLSGPGRENRNGFTALQLLHQLLGSERIEGAITRVTARHHARHLFRTQLRASARGAELTVEAAVPHELGVETLAELRRALAELARSGIDREAADREVRARDHVLPFRMEGTSARMREAVAHLLSGRSIDKEKAATAPAIDLKAVTAEWRTLLDPARIVWVILGRGSDLSPELSAAGIEHARGDAFDVVTGNLLTAREASLFKLPGPIATVQAEEMILAAIEAQGGFEALERIQSYAVEDSIYVQPGGQPVAGSRKLFVHFPDRYREELAMSPLGGRSLVQVVNGNEVWRNHLGHVSDVSGPRRDELLNRLWMDGLRLFHRYGEPGAIAFIVDPEVIGGETLDGLQISSPDGRWVRTYFHPQSRLVVKRASEKPSTEQVFPVEELFTDYRPVEGVFVPFTSATYLEGHYAIETHMISIDFNVPLDRDLFVRAE